MLKTNLANTNTAYAAQIAGINDTYSGLIDTQKIINNLNLSRVKAYGLSSGNAMSTPIEFTYAVSNTEQAGISEVKKLDNTRNSLIAQAESAREDADAKLMQASMDSEVEARAASLEKIKTDQQTQLKATQTNLLAAAVTTFGKQFTDEQDPTKRDALIKQIVNGSGGMLDYGSVYGSLSSNAAATTKATQDAETHSADMKLKAAQTANEWANASKTKSANTQASVFSAIDDRLQPGVQMPGRKDGGTYLDENGFITKDGFNLLVQGSHQNGITRSTFLKEYGGYLDPGGYGNYGLTKAEQDMLSDVNKTTPIIIPQAPQS